MTPRSCIIAAVVLLLTPAHLLIAQETATTQRVSHVPAYQVIFDDFRYASTGYPDPPGDTNLFGENPWIDRSGSAGFTGRAWFYYNWRWQENEGRIHPDGTIEVNPVWPYSVKLSAIDGYTRDTSVRSNVPVQMESGFTFDKGTWVINVKLADLEAIRYFTQAFWIISPVATTPAFGDIRSWVEFNHEWQNWFSVNYAPRTNGSIDMLTDDIWAANNDWVRRQGYAGNVFESETLPAANHRTYMANGLRMFERDALSLDTGETAGGVSMRNPLQPGSDAFSCYRSTKGIVTHIDDPAICMGALQKDLNGDATPWVQLMIQYDGKEVVYSALANTAGVGYTHMESRATLNQTGLPLKVNLGIHTPNAEIALLPGEESTMEIDWFYYSPNTTLSPLDVNADVASFRENAWDRVNLDGYPLNPPPSRPWQIGQIKTPDLDDPNWLVIPTLRESNGVQIQWNYRTKLLTDTFFSEWSGWQTGGFTLDVQPRPDEIELDVRVIDRHATDYADRVFWANTSCTAFSYVTMERSDCIGGPQEDSPYSFDQRPRRLQLEANYPNPVQDYTTFRFGIPDSSRVMLLIFDATGREVDRVLDTQLGTGYHTFRWEVPDLAAGTYFYHIITDEASLTRTLTLLP
ncbi:MAG: T9SS type A sorting domain-containing protein [Bacteroidota bacterium]